ncbi:hypothetical protein [Amycolatopsis sp. NPDC003731]
MTPKFEPGQRVEHPRWGAGRIEEVYAVAQTPEEETEYAVRLPGYRYPAYLGEHSLTAR